jgi:hypothetical protein
VAHCALGDDETMASVGDLRPPLWLIAVLVAGVVGLFAVLGDDQPHEADELRALLPLLQAQIERRDVDALMVHVASDYRDQAGRDRAAARRALQRQFRRHRKRHIALHLRSLEAADGRGSIRVLTAVGNRPMADFEAMLQEAEMVIHVELRLRKEASGWRCVSTSWRRPTPLDLL